MPREIQICFGVLFFVAGTMLVNNALKGSGFKWIKRLWGPLDWTPS